MTARSFTIVIFLLLALPKAVRAQDANEVDRPSRNADFERLAPFLDSLRIEFGVPGVALAVFDDKGTLFEHVGGVKSHPDGAPLDHNTVFEAASISKPVFAYIVLSLVSDGVLELDTPLTELVPHVPEIAYDPRAALLTPRLLLAHRGGLPNWRSRLNLAAQSHSDLFATSDTLRFVGDPGQDFRYSGEGYVLLQLIVEELTGKSLNELATERVFDPLGMARTSFQFKAKSRLNYSHGHNSDGIPDKWELSVTLASSTLHTTAADLAKFGSHLAAQLRRDGRYRLIMTPAVTVESEGDLVHSWGLGLGILEDGPRTYFYHGGNNVIFIADFIYGVDQNLGYVLLTNSANGPRVVDALQERVYGTSFGSIRR